MSNNTNFLDIFIASIMLVGINDDINNSLYSFSMFNKTLSLLSYKRSVIVVLVFGFTSGFVISISSNLLNFWLAKEGISKISIGLFSLVSLPYAVNFLLAPFIDKLFIPYFSNKLGQYRSWIFIIQIMIILLILMLSTLDPKKHLLYVSICSTFVALSGSVQDIALGALRASILNTQEHNLTSGFYILGYRLGMLTSNAGVIYLSYFLSWSIIYKILAFMVAVCMLLVILVTNKSVGVSPPPQFLIKDRNFISRIISPIGSISFITLVLVFLVLYRLSDNILNTMLNVFLLDMGFNEIEIATFGYTLGITASIIGGIFAGPIITKLGLYKSLFYFGIGHSICHILFILQAKAGHNIIILFCITSMESFTGGMAMAAYIAFIMSLCRGQYKATQYALFTAMMGLSRSIFPGVSGIMAKYLGWVTFFEIIFILSLPALILIKILETNHITKQNVR